MIDLMKMKESVSNKRSVLVGVAASPGYAIGKTHSFVNQEIRLSSSKIEINSVVSEIQRFHKNIKIAIKGLNQLKIKTQTAVGVEESRIFDTHMMMLQDPTLIDFVEKSIREDKYNAGYAFHEAIHAQIKIFEKIEQEFAREKAADLKDIYNRVMNLFSNTNLTSDLSDLDEAVILIGNILTPSQLIDVRKDVALGFATDTGGRTSHVAILARSMRIPAVTGLKEISVVANPGEVVIIDGSAGIVIVNPHESDVKRYKAKIDSFSHLEKELYLTRDLDPITTDGKYIKLDANIELAIEADAVDEYGASGVGLYRSEFLFFRKNLPSKREQCEAYRYILKKVFPKTAVIRTLDAGGDKLVADLSVTEEANPFMGYRSIRLCLDRKDIFIEQLEALFMASDSGKLRIMFPMITSVEELRQSKVIFYECIERLSAEGWGQNENIEIGVMIEVPSAVEMVEELAREVDFFSIGTNDLIQFTLAVDRSNEKIASMFEPHHPAVLRKIKRVVDAAHNEGIDVSVCGEMTSDPLSALLLVGLGVDSLSMNPWSIMEVKKFIRSISYQEARQVASEVMKYSTTQLINNYLEVEYRQRIVELGISSFISKKYNLDKDEKVLVKVNDDIVGLSTLE